MLVVILGEHHTLFAKREGSRGRVLVHSKIAAVRQYLATLLQDNQIDARMDARVQGLLARAEAAANVLADLEARGAGQQKRNQADKRLERELDALRAVLAKAEGLVWYDVAKEMRNRPSFEEETNFELRRRWPYFYSDMNLSSPNVSLLSQAEYDRDLAGKPGFPVGFKLRLARRHERSWDIIKRDVVSDIHQRPFVLAEQALKERRSDLLARWDKSKFEASESGQYIQQWWFRRLERSWLKAQRKLLFDQRMQSR